MVVGGQRIAMALVMVSFCWAPAKADDAPDGMVKPAYAEDGNLVLPQAYRTWVFVGASLGLSYSPREPAQESAIFHHVYIQPQAYKHYVDTGNFPEKTMLVMENYSAATKKAQPVKGENPLAALHGRFEHKRVGLEVALKDSEHFEDRWAYFNFTARASLKKTAKAFPRAVCWNCHNDHALDDNVFVQFYPVLLEEYEKRSGTKVHRDEASKEGSQGR